MGNVLDGWAYKPANTMYQTMQGEIFPFIKNLHTNTISTYAKYMEDAIFKIPTPRLLEQVITALDELYSIVEKQPDCKDARGDLYEYMLSRLTTAGTNGQFRTPRHIIRMMVELLDLRPGDSILGDKEHYAVILNILKGDFMQQNTRL